MLPGEDMKGALLLTTGLLAISTIHHASLENTSGEVDETSRIWGLGFTVGI